MQTYYKQLLYLKLTLLVISIYIIVFLIFLIINKYNLIFFIIWKLFISYNKKLINNIEFY
jgi:hypothetical protein